MCSGSDRLTPSEAVQKTQTGAWAIVRPMPSRELPTENSCELKVAPWVAPDDSADTEMSVRPMASALTYPLCWYFPG